MRRQRRRSSATSGRRRRGGGVRRIGGQWCEREPVRIARASLTLSRRSMLASRGRRRARRRCQRRSDGGCLGTGPRSCRRAVEIAEYELGRTSLAAASRNEPVFTLPQSRLQYVEQQLHGGRSQRAWHPLGQQPLDDLRPALADLRFRFTDLLHRDPYA